MSVMEQETVRERMMNLEREHMQAIQTLEATFEKRLQLHQSEMHAQMAAKDDQQMHVEEAMKRVNQECAGIVTHCLLAPCVPRVSLLCIQSEVQRRTPAQAGRCF